MRPWPVIIAAVCAGVLSGGCSTPKPIPAHQPTEDTPASRQQAVELIELYAAAVSADRAADVRPLLSPALSPREALSVMGRVSQACWLADYSGYRIEAGPAIAAVSRKQWESGFLRLTVVTDNRYGDRVEEVLDLVNMAGRWYLADPGVTAPYRGAELDPPPQVKEEMRANVAEILGYLQSQQFGRIHVMLPREATHRTVEPRWWSFGSETRSIAIMEDLQLLKDLHIYDWPDPAESLPMAWLGPGLFAAVYDISYNWPAGGITELDIMHLQIVLRRGENAWELAALRLTGKAFP